MESKYAVNLDQVSENSSHRIILRRIAPGSRILECGCASGYMTRYMKEQLGAEVSIVELNPDDYQKARPYACDGICADLEGTDWSDYFQEQRFDTILFADVLEHLRKPEDVLARAARLLKEDGTVIASIPNIGHADIIIRLLNGQWNYTPVGLLDNTHTHFWAEKNLEGLFSQAGLSLVDKDFTILPPFATEQACRELPEGLMPCVAAIYRQPYSDVYQFIYSARKHAAACVDHYAERHLRYGAKPALLAEYEAGQAQAEEERKAALARAEEEREAALARAEEEREELRETCGKLTEERAALRREYAETKTALEQQLEQSQLELEGMQTQLASARLCYDMISNSRFWRLTKPLRIAFDQAKAVRSREKEYVDLAKKAAVTLRTQGFSAVAEKYRQRKLRLSGAYDGEGSYLIHDNAFVDHAGAYPEPLIPEEWLAMQGQQPLISLIIAAKQQPERGACLRKALESLRGQRYQKLEVILVADSAELPYVQELSCEFADALTLKSLVPECEARDRWAYWSAGACAASGSLIGFLEQEDTLSPNCLAYILEAYNESSVRGWELYLIPDAALARDGTVLARDWKSGAGWTCGGAQGLLHFGVFEKARFQPDRAAFEKWLLSLTREQIFISPWIGCYGAALEDVWGESKVRCIPFYLPQFHAIPENDTWWGEGFTEWVNVKRAKPLYPGHHQPRVPGELGYYDLAGEAGAEIQRKQIALAKEYGLSGFCYYYYWFDNGKRLLEMPLDRHLHDQTMDFPFCLCWANENWTRNWDGLQSEVLMPQTYQPGWETQFILDLLPYIKDERYICVNGAPFLLLYHLQDIPNPAETIRTWREVARQNGIERLHISAVRRSVEGSELALSGHTIDSLTDFPPHLLSFYNIDHDEDIRFGLAHGQVKDYRKACKLHAEMPKQNYTYFRTAMLEWDNTARRGKRAYFFEEFSLGEYQKWLYAAKRYALRQNRPGEDLVFINAWNEWAEGACLEPSEPLGRGALEATKEILERR